VPTRQWGGAYLLSRVGSALSNVWGTKTGSGFGVAADLAFVARGVLCLSGMAVRFEVVVAPFPAPMTVNVSTSATSAVAAEFKLKMKTLLADLPQRRQPRSPACSSTVSPSRPPRLCCRSQYRRYQQGGFHQCDCPVFDTVASSARTFLC